MGLRSRATPDDRGTHHRLSFRPDPCHRFGRLFATPVSWMVLFPPEARTISRPEAGLERTGAGDSVLCSLHHLIRPGEVAPASCRLSREPALSLSTGRLALALAERRSLQT